MGFTPEEFDAVHQAEIDRLRQAGKLKGMNGNESEEEEEGSEEESEEEREEGETGYVRPPMLVEEIGLNRNFCPVYLLNRASSKIAGAVWGSGPEKSS